MTAESPRRKGRDGDCELRREEETEIDQPGSRERSVATWEAPKAVIEEARICRLACRGRNEVDTICRVDVAADSIAAEVRDVRLTSRQQIRTPVSAEIFYG